MPPTATAAPTPQPTPLPPTPTVSLPSTIPSMSIGRSSHTTTLLRDDQILIVGGDGNDGEATASVERYDRGTNSWSEVAPLAQGRRSHTATLLQNGRVLVAGGNAGKEALATAEMYDPDSNTWSVLGSLKTARFAHSATLLSDGRVLVVGGVGESRFATAEIFNPSTGQWTPAASTKDTHSAHRAILLLDGRVLIIDGKEQCELYNPESNTWSSAGSLPLGRFINPQASLLTDGRVIVTGGTNLEPESPSGGQPIGPNMNNVEIYDPMKNQWTSVAPMNEARSHHISVILPNQKLLVAGGYRGGVASGTVPLTAEIYDPAIDTWSSAGRLPQGRSGSGAVVLSGGTVVVIAGYASNGNDRLATVDMYVPDANRWLSSPRR
jgi:N-acetylneuraminic acid mutarotase